MTTKSNDQPEFDRLRAQYEAQLSFHKTLNKLLGTLLLGLLCLFLRFAIPVARAAVPVQPFDVFSDGERIGVFQDPVTGHDFVLINHLEDESLEPFAQYLTNVGNSSILATRDWKDCQRLSTVQWAACNTAHGISGAVQSIGTANLGAFINDEVNNAFTNGRDNQKPRSICHVYDGDNICLSWANYDTNTLKNGESGDIGGFAAACIKKGWSSEFKATDSNNGVIYICVSNRATGCGSGVCGQ